MQGEQKQRRIENFTAESQAEKIEKILKKCLTNRKQKCYNKSTVEGNIKPSI